MKIIFFEIMIVISLNNIIFAPMMNQVLSSKYFSICQDLQSRSFYFETPSEYYMLEFCQLLTLRHKIQCISLQSMLVEDNVPLELISICDSHYVLMLNILQIIDLKQLLDRVMCFSEVEIAVSSICS